MTPLQGSLLDAGDEAPTLAPLGDGMTRTTLSRGAWIDHQLGWLHRSDAVFAELEASVPWRAERRQMYERIVDVPRLVSWYDASDALPHPLVGEAKRLLSDRYRDIEPRGFATAGMCLYRDGRDSVAWHGDTIGRGRREDTLVAIVSLGEPRALLLRPRGGGGASQRFMLGHGDLLVMGGSCQRTWEHAIPKTAKPCGPRISVQFRPPGVR
ncbi:MAG TPA: alpha-ketoglutarate-dependent dioxygenase AlkB [Actinomycetes bacterium]|nr:alpha-ketoglutarate-dependent dioxygenase AlkB [Actinomycetes bacterium]